MRLALTGILLLVTFGGSLAADRGPIEFCTLLGRWFDHVFSPTSV